MTLPDTHRVLYLTAAETVELLQDPLSRPGPGELLMRVDAATTCGTDLKVFLRGGHPRMLQVPCPFGHEMSGTVVACGSGVEEWREGDAVVVANSASCGRCAPCRSGRENLCEDLQYLNGAFAEHLLVPERFVRRSTHARPAGLDPAVAALAEPLACVLHGLSLCDFADTEEAVVLGSGPIGLMFAAELADRGIRVIVGDLRKNRLETAETLGAAHTAELAGDVADCERLQAVTHDGRGASLVVEASGTPVGWANGVRSVRTGGTVVLFGGCDPRTEVACDSYHLHYSELTLRGAYHHRPATFAAAIQQLASGNPDLSVLIQEEHGLSGVETALRRMGERRILKAAIRPHG
jgi:L-iditol 2-dehydrogenase